MGILDELLGRVRTVAEGVENGAMVGAAIQSHSEDIMSLQKEQLLQGKTSGGDDIRPYYSEDLRPGGYFNSVESAKRYADWKASGISYPAFGGSRNPDAPNLYINGKFHSELGVQFTATTVAIVPETGYAATIVTKYGYETFGLMPENWNRIFYEYGAYNELMNEIKAILYT